MVTIEKRHVVSRALLSSQLTIKLCPQVNISWSWKPRSSSPCWCPGTKCLWTALSPVRHQTRLTRDRLRASGWRWPTGAASGSLRCVLLCGNSIWAKKRTLATGNSCFSKLVVALWRYEQVLCIMVIINVCDVDYYYNNNIVLM